jgi:hypothetical protein
MREDLCGPAFRRLQAEPRGFLGNGSAEGAVLGELEGRKRNKLRVFNPQHTPNPSLSAIVSASLSCLRYGPELYRHAPLGCEVDPLT